jgi:arylsulfatase A-like enzyme
MANAHHALAIALALVALVSCGGREEPLNVIIIGVDTLRPDHLGCYGYGRDTSPAVDRLAAGGVLFENVISQSPWTSPSFASVLTSLYPTQTGLVSVGTSMRDAFPTLGTLLKAEGYATGAIINATVMKPEFGMDRGFDYYYTTPREGRIADGTTRDALAWIDSVHGQPFFLFAHYYDPHEPYAPPSPYDAFFEEDYSGSIGSAFVLHDHFPDVKGMNFEPLRSLTDEDWDHIRTLYDGEIRFTDEAVRDLMKGLEERGLHENTLVVFLSDHGEEFFEHEGFGHGHTLYGEVIRVPLVLWYPRTLPAGERVESQVRLIDVMPTVLDILGIGNEDHMEGVSLLPLVDGGGETAPVEGRLFPSDMAFTEGMLRGPDRKSLTQHPYKIIYNVKTRRDMLFNLERDPGELVNLVLKERGPREALGTPLFRAMLDISDTWYIEMNCGGEPREFDIRLKSERELTRGRIYFYKAIDTAGRLHDIGHLVTPGRGEHELMIEGLRVTERLTLAVKADPDNVPLEFDLAFDGKPAAQQTFLGESLASLGHMPFTQRANKPRLKARGVPVERPDPPYFLVWLTQGRYGGGTAIDMNEETRRELRAIGYIQ